MNERSNDPTEGAVIKRKEGRHHDTRNPITTTRSNSSLSARSSTTVATDGKTGTKLTDTATRTAAQGNETSTPLHPIADNGPLEHPHRTIMYHYHHQHHYRCVTHRLIRRTCSEEILRLRRPAAGPHSFRVTRQGVRKGSRSDVAKASLRAVGANRHELLLPGRCRHGSGEDLPTYIVHRECFV